MVRRVIVPTFVAVALLLAWNPAAHAAPPTLTAPAAVAYWFKGATEAWLSYRSAGAVIQIHQNGKGNGYSLSVGGTHRVRVYWGMTTGLQNLTVAVTSGTVTIKRLSLRGPSPKFVSAPAVTYAIMGDSIAEGYYSGGPKNDSAGWFDQLPGVMGNSFGDSNQAVGGTTATCFGQYHVSDVIAAKPSRVVVAYGVNDLGHYNCSTDLSRFTDAMTSIADQLVAGLPGVPVYFSAVLPWNGTTETVRAQWNAAIRQVAEAHGFAYVDPSSAIVPGVDTDGLHPNLQGHTKLAMYWASVL
jgi:lysophospholipase L1-like esterase